MNLSIENMMRKKIIRVATVLLIFSLVIESFFTSKQAFAKSKNTKVTYMMLTSSIKSFKKSGGNLIVKCTSDAPIMCKEKGKWKEKNTKKLKLKLSKKVKWKKASKKTKYSWIKKRIKLDYDYGDIDYTGALYVEVKNKKVTSVMVYWED